MLNGKNTLALALQQAGPGPKKPAPKAAQPWYAAMFPQRSAGAMNPMVQAVPEAKQVVRERLRDNVYPMGYQDPLSRVFNAVVLNKKDEMRQVMEGSPQFRERMAYWNKYLGYDYDQGEIAPSAYRPTRAKDPNAQYFASASTEAHLPDNLYELSQDDDDGTLMGPSTFASVDEIRAALKGSYLRSGTARRGKKFEGFHAPHLGQMAVDVGEDEKGYYLSYYDSWDINPFKGITASENNQDYALFKNKEDASGGLGKPFELYGRVYYDKKTGRRLTPKKETTGRKATSSGRTGR